MTPVNVPASFNKNGQQGVGGASNGQPGGGQGSQAGPVSSAPAVSVPPGHVDPSQNGSLGMDGFGAMVCRHYANPYQKEAHMTTQDGFPGMELTNPALSGDVLNDFDFDSFLHDNDGDNQPFDFNQAFTGMEGNEIGAD